MRTLGIDLASQARTTAACVVEWQDGAARVAAIELGAGDERVLELASGAAVVGIDAPFGWPAPFVAMVRDHAAGRAGVGGWGTERRDALRFRRTDVRVRAKLGRWPLSVSSDLIGIVAMRCAGLLDRLGVVDRSGDGRVFETYPALALAVWGFASRGYKNARNEVILARLVAALRAGCPWLTMDEATATLCARSDHAFDALIAALVARAGGLGLTERPDADDAALARIEGWIAIPIAGSLARLPSDAPIEP